MARPKKVIEGQEASHPESVTTTKKTIFELWKCQLHRRQTEKNGNKFTETVAEKLKMIRENIKIEDEQASLLNDSLVHNDFNRYADLYYLPNSETYA